MSAFATTTTEAIELDLSGLTSVLAVVLAIGVVVLMVWMWRIGNLLESAVEPGAEPVTDHSSPAVSAVPDRAAH
ncbi:MULTISPECIES: hypothetical protein [unclassified Microcella]|uniref:hypothetical protein n=1 Tax=unclassified Microcella TaxID=2630066 RepID=UPI000ACCC276|nr:MULTISPECIES: hypothetical protein [unclassified Microcella]